MFYINLITLNIILYIYNIILIIYTIVQAKPEKIIHKNSLTASIFGNVNLGLINSLISKLNTKLKKLPNGDLDPYSFVKQEDTYIDGLSLAENLNSQYESSPKNDNKVFVFCEIEGTLHIVLPKERFIELVNQHNLKVNMPKLNEYLEEKEAYIMWRDYNTPSIKDIKITPLLGTDLDDLCGDEASSIYLKWMACSDYLIHEFNILNKAKLYGEALYNKNLELINNNEYKDAYYYWKERQVEIIDLTTHFEEKHYIPDFELDYLYREICEDITYVILNILLAKNIIESTSLKEYKGSLDENKFLSELKSIIFNHYEENNEGYKLLYELRKYSSNYYLDIKFLEQVYKIQKNNYI
jgi:hypothetical protein